MWVGNHSLNSAWLHFYFLKGFWLKGSHDFYNPVFVYSVKEYCDVAVMMQQLVASIEDTV